MKLYVYLDSPDSNKCHVRTDTIQFENFEIYSSEFRVIKEMCKTYLSEDLIIAKKASIELIEYYSKLGIIDVQLKNDKRHFGIKDFKIKNDILSIFNELQLINTLDIAEEWADRKDYQVVVIESPEFKNPKIYMQGTDISVSEDDLDYKKIIFLMG